MNVLIPNIGRRGYLVRYLKKSYDFHGKVFVSDCDSTASGLYGDNDGAFILSRPVDDEKKYVGLLHDLCVDNNIDVVIPVIDPEVFILSKYRDLFEKDSVFVSVSSNKVLDICYNKIAMNDFLETNGFEIPKTYDNISQFEKDINDKRIRFPAIIKPIYGSGSEATYRVYSIEETKAMFREGMIIQEFIDGQEYGVDVFNNLEGIPIRCVVKRKISMRSGETDKAETVMDETIKNLMILLGERLGHICNLDCDLISRGGRFYIIDLNPRFGGGYPATHEAGVNLLELVVKLSEGLIIDPDFEYKPGVYTMKEILPITTERLVI